MAVPTVRAGAVAARMEASFRPTLIPHEVGDVLVVDWMWNHSDINLSSTPAGWNIAANFSGQNNGPRVARAWHVVTEVLEQFPLFSYTGSWQFGAYVARALVGVDPQNPFTASSTATFSNFAGSNAPSMTPVDAKDRLHETAMGHSAAEDSQTTGAWSPSSGWTDWQAHGRWRSLLVGSRPWTTSAETGTVTRSFNTSNTSTAVTYLVNPTSQAPVENDEGTVYGTDESGQAITDALVALTDNRESTGVMYEAGETGSRSYTGLEQAPTRFRMRAYFPAGGTLLSEVLVGDTLVSTATFELPASEVSTLCNHDLSAAERAQIGASCTHRWGPV